ncbi:heterokaryon incompatibility protein [Phlyctema vagabunda]|uniref:Heterokaryon incompatibility protein n=1 Tax=Phlyctema vagabunda TaxID=108571 RepID=A0ABR4PPS4_9HELO
MLATAYIMDLEGEICTKQQENLPTDIRIMLSQSWNFLTSGSENISMYDVLLIQSGDGLSEEDEEEYGGTLPVVLKLVTPRKSPIVIDGCRIGRVQANPFLGSTENFNIARRWLDECSGKHELCPSAHKALLPTRVIDIGESSSGEKPRLLNTLGQMGTYLALSHCWGGHMPVKLLSTNLQQFGSAIPFQDLPANFQDAITITRELGFRYLWIDSLCIIQDSHQDWENEAKKMADVYQNALLTIAASTSSKSTEGILKIDKSSDGTDIPMHRLRLNDDETSFDFVYLTWKDGEEEDLNRIFLKGSLASRGWTLQERVLSHRILHYGKRQIYWQCRQGFQAADGIPEGNLTPQQVSYPGISQHLANKVTASAGVNIQSVYEDWYDLVNEYSAKSLTYGNDKFPALAGLATEVSLATGDQYMAGVWRRDWRRGVLWYPEMNTAVHIKPYRAPSWSWATTDEPIIFPQSRANLARTEFDAKLLEIDSELLGQRQLAEMEPALIVVRGLTCSLFRSRQIIRRNTATGIDAMHYFDEPIYEETDSRFSAKVEPLDLVSARTLDGQYGVLSMPTSLSPEAPTDYQIDPELILDQEYMLLLIGFSSFEWSEEENKRPDNAHALILVRSSEEEGCYERVGYSKFGVTDFDLHKWATECWSQQDLAIC